MTTPPLHATLRHHHGGLADATPDHGRAGKTVLAYGAWGSTSIFDVAASTGYFFRGSPDDLSRDKEVEALLKQGDETTDPAKRLLAYGPAMKRITEQAYWVPVMAYSQIVAHHKALRFTPSEDEVPRFFNASWSR